MIILLSGSDSYRIQQKLNKYQEKFLRDIDATGINIETLEGQDLTVESFRRAVLSGGLFVKKRMVIVKNLFSNCQDENVFKEVKKFVKKNKNTLDVTVVFVEIKTSQKRASSQAPSPPVGSFSRAVSQADDSNPKPQATLEDHKPGQGEAPSISNKLLKILKSQKYSENFEPLGSIKLINWLKKEVETRQGKISLQATQFLVTNIGSNLWQLSNEIDKLIAFKNSDEIQLEDVQQFVKTKLDENIFNLTDAFGRKNKALALKLISDQIESGSAWQYLLTMFARQIKIVLQIKLAQESDVPPYQFAKTLGLHPYVVKKTIPQVRLFSIEELKKIYSQLLQIDLNLKTSQTNPELLFDLLVVR